MQLIPRTRPSQVISFHGSILVLCLNASSTLHTWTLVTYASPFLITSVWSRNHLSWPSSAIRVPMSDLSTLSSGTPVHPSNRCLTTLWFLGARALQDTGPRCLWDPAFVAPILLVVNNTRGLVGTLCYFWCCSQGVLCALEVVKINIFGVCCAKGSVFLEGFKVTSLVVLCVICIDCLVDCLLASGDWM